jgi:hypothetical protein
MDRAIEKFIDRLGIRLEIKRASNIYYTKDGQSICVLITAHYKGRKNYEQYHCYTFNLNKKDVSYESGNSLIELEGGIFSYLGNNPEVNKYFERKVRELAKEFFMNQYF